MDFPSPYGLLALHNFGRKSAFVVHRTSRMALALQLGIAKALIAD
jgi:hypothetical protein